MMLLTFSFFFPQKGRAAEVTAAADGDGDYCDTTTTTMGPPALEPEAWGLG
jgi:hypothetical protein